MASRRDQLMSYQFVIQRVVSALVMREADPAQAPFRRGVGAVFAGTMIAIIAVAAVGVYGLVVKGGNKTWRSGSFVILEQETGTRYIYDREKNVLHPVINAASARLILGTPAPIQGVSRNSLVGTPRGLTLGIPGAPDGIPDAKRLSRGDWTLCSRPDRDLSGTPINSTVLFVGQRPPEGQVLGDQALLVEDQKSRQKYLVWHNHRYLLTKPDMMVGALGIGSQPALPVGKAWLDGLPKGDDITPIAVGTPGAASAFPDAKVGQVLLVQTQGGAKQYYAALADGIAEITEFQSDLMLGDPDIADKAYAGTGRAAPIEISASQANNSDTKSNKKLRPGAGPTSPPPAMPATASPASSQSTACAAFSDSDPDPQVMIEADVPPSNAPDTEQQTPEGAPLADRVVVEPGWGVMVMAHQGENASGGGQLYLITDQGRSFAVPSMQIMMVVLGPEAAAAAQGTDPIKPVSLPASLVGRVPLGPGLNPDAARKPVTGRA